MKNIFSIFLKTLFILAVLSSLYLVFFLFPKAKEKKTLEANYSNLVQNRIAYVGLTKLDPANTNAVNQKNELLSKIGQTQKEGLSLSDPKIREIYIRQAKIIEELKSSKTPEEGFNLLKGTLSIQLLTDQTNLIMEIKSRIEKL